MHFKLQSEESVAYGRGNVAVDIESEGISDAAKFGGECGDVDDTPLGPRLGIRVE